MIGFDYTERIDPAALKTAGATVVFRYVMPQTPFWTKALRTAEANELLAAGIPIVSNWETTATAMRGGGTQGITDALQLAADWRALGAPTNLAGYFSADWDVQQGEVSLCLDYLAGAASVLGKPRTGVYGGYRIVKAAIDAGYRGWQTAAWSSGQWDPRAVARQTGQKQTIGGVDTDVNEIIDLSGLGAWHPEEDDVTPQDIEAIAEAVYRHGEEDVNQAGTIRHNTPLGNLAHGAHESVNSPTGAVITRLDALESNVKAIMAHLGIGGAK